MTPVFESERLQMTDWALDDAAEAFAIYGDPEVTAGLSGEPVPTVEAMRERLAKIEEKYSQIKPYGFWALRLKDGSKIVGAVILQPLPDHEEIEVGWHLAQSEWGHGYATEAGLAALKFGFEQLGLQEIFAVVRPWNERSKAVTLRLGMTPLGLTTEYYGRETELFRITAWEFSEMQAKWKASRSSC